MMIASRLNRWLGTFLPGALRIVFCALLSTCVFVAGLQVSAIAAPNDTADSALSQAADMLDQVAGEGASDMIQGKAQEDLGKVKRSVGQATGQIEGATEQVKGRAQKDLGRTKQAVDEASDAVEDTTENFVDSVKGFFGQ